MKGASFLSLEGSDLRRVLVCGDSTLIEHLTVLLFSEVMTIKFESLCTHTTLLPGRI